MSGIDIPYGHDSVVAICPNYGHVLVSSPGRMQESSNRRTVCLVDLRGGASPAITHTSLSINDQH